MDLVQLFKQFIKDEKLFHHGQSLLVAVSGGVDSMVLCELCKQCGFDFTIAHCNFGLRGDESDQDEAFVRLFGEAAGVKVLVKRFETEAYATRHKLSVQVAARELRYDWFLSILNDGISSEQGRNLSQHAYPKPLNAEPLNPELLNYKPLNPELLNSKLPNSKPRTSYLLTAHHADDNIETVTMNFFKGTGIAGLRGILPSQGKIVRPLLFARKASLLQFARQHHLKYREDSSNASDKYTRNYFRHQLLPLVENAYPQAEENIAKSITRFREIEQLYQQSIEKHKKYLLEWKANEVHIPVRKLKKSEPLVSILYEIVKDYGFSAHQAGEVADLLDSESGKFIQSATYRIIKNRDWLIIAPNKTEEAQTILIQAENSTIHFAMGKLSFRQLTTDHYPLSTDFNTAQLDASKIKFPLLLRTRKPGDYFYPLGMQKKKKINRFLTDLKLAKTEKENTWVLEMNKSILWVVGKRIDDRFKITDHTKNVLEISFTPNGLK